MSRTSEIQELNKGSGLYYSKLGTARTTSSNWKLITYINVTSVEIELKNYETLENFLNTLCTHTNNEIHILACEHSIKSYTHKLPLLKKQFSELKELINHKDKINRKRRSLDFLGSIWKFIAGSPDANDAEYYNEAIRETQQDQTRLELLLKEQIQIVSTTISNFNLTITSLQTYTHKLNENIENLNKLSTQVEMNSRQIRKMQLVQNVLSELSILTDTLENQLNSIINSILFAKQGTLSPYILSPYQLINELRKFHSRLTDKSFPLPLEPSNGHILLELSNLDVYYYSSNLVFIINIPLVDAYVYDYYHLFPLPIINPESLEYHTIQPSYQYLLMTIDRKRFVVLNELCKRIINTHFLCQEKQTQTRAGKEPCEVTLFQGITRTLPENCRVFKLVGHVFTWASLDSNSWLITASDLTSVDIVCQSQPMTSKEFQHTIILHLDVKCQAFVGNLQLIASSDETSNITYYIPQIPIYPDCCLEEDKEKEVESIHFQQYEPIPIRLEELNNAKGKLAQINENLDDIIFHKHMTKNFKWYTIATFIVSVIIALCCCRCCCKCDPVTWLWKYLKKQPCTSGCLKSLTIHNHVGPRYGSRTNVQMSSLRDIQNEDPIVRSIHSRWSAEEDDQDLSRRWTTLKT